MLTAENLRLWRGDKEVFHIERMEFLRGEVVALVGPNGAGKTSLLLTLALLLEPTQGVIRFEGQATGPDNLLAIRRHMAVVFQESLLLDMSVRANLLAALNLRGVGRREARRRSDRWLERFGIMHLAHRAARALSGGEAQRASLARAFALEPRFLFLDEPFASLDYPTRNALLQELGTLLRGGDMTALFVTHDYSEIPHLADRTAVLFEGKIKRFGTNREIFGDEVLERKTWAPWED